MLARFIRNLLLVAAALWIVAAAMHLWSERADRRRLEAALQEPTHGRVVVIREEGESGFARALSDEAARWGARALAVVLALSATQWGRKMLRGVLKGVARGARAMWSRAPEPAFVRGSRPAWAAAVAGVVIVVGVGGVAVFTGAPIAPPSLEGLASHVGAAAVAVFG